MTQEDLELETALARVYHLVPGYYQNPRELGPYTTRCGIRMSGFEVEKRNFAWEDCPECRKGFNAPKRY